jgi:hypothetical protein
MFTMAYPKFLRTAYNVLQLQRSARRHGKNLTLIQNNTANIKANAILAFSVLRNEAPRLPYFLAYYRQLGVTHFFFIDNGSTDNFLSLVGDQADCSIWHTTASYKASNFGVYWLNYLLGRYGSGHWCLTLDPDEFLSYPYCDSRSLGELTAYLAQEGKDSLFGIMLDMYSQEPIDKAIY